MPHIADRSKIIRQILPPQFRSPDREFRRDPHAAIKSKVQKKGEDQRCCFPTSWRAANWLSLRLTTGQNATQRTDLTLGSRFQNQTVYPARRRHLLLIPPCITIIYVAGSCGRIVEILRFSEVAITSVEKGNDTILWREHDLDGLVIFR